VKALQTGCTVSADGALRPPDLEAYGRALEGKIADLHCIAAFRAPCSPHFAARLEGHHIAVDEIREKIKKIMEQSDFTLVEGAGGLLAPIGEDGYCFADLIEDLVLPAVLVGANRVGALNHFSLSLRELSTRPIAVAAAICCELDEATGEEKLFRGENLRFLRQRFPRCPFYAVPYCANGYGAAEDALAPLFGELPWKT
jgi:dethiobiotin synthase